jgi:hypothetical protein
MFVRANVYKFISHLDVRSNRGTTSVKATLAGTSESSGLERRDVVALLPRKEKKHSPTSDARIKPTQLKVPRSGAELTAAGDSICFAIDSIGLQKNVLITTINTSSLQPRCSPRGHGQLLPALAGAVEVGAGK